MYGLQKSMKVKEGKRQHKGFELSLSGQKNKYYIKIKISV